MTNETITLQSTVRYRAVGDDGVLVHLDNGRVIVVNEVGLFIVHLLGEQATHQALVEAVAAEFDVSADQAGADIDQFLRQLEEEQVLATSDE